MAAVAMLTVGGATARPAEAGQSDPLAGAASRLIRGMTAPPRDRAPEYQDGGPARYGQDASGLCNSWDSSTRSRFHHTIEAAPGRVRLRIEARTTASGGETVAVYPSDHGDRGRVRIMFVIATTRGHTASGYATVPRPASGEQLGRLPIVVDVENAGGRRHQGDYCITVHPAD
jgi:hypothetical protein